MSRQLSGKSPGETSEASPLSLLVHAADSQSSGKGGRKGGYNVAAQREETKFRVPDRAPTSTSISRLDSINHQGLLSQLRGGALGDEELLSNQYGVPYAALVAAQQQQQQQAALAFANDIRTAVAAAQLQNHDQLLARNTALRQLEALGGAPGGGIDSIQQELDRQRLEELERRQLLAAASVGDPIASLVTRRQLDVEHQLRQQKLGRQLADQGAESLLARGPNPRAAVEARGAPVPAASKQKSKASFQKTPGSVVVPCRARGMPMDHNFKTAYFVIPENVKHGEELLCSYFACRNAGIKFRFCTHCKVPVAKRNFRKRHKHGMTTSADADDDDDVEDTTTRQTKKPSIPLPVNKAPIKEKEIVQACDEVPKKVAVEKKIPEKIGSKINESSENEESVASDTRENSQSVKLRPFLTDADAKTLISISEQNLPKISEEREQLWAAMLAKRPPTKDGDAVSAWLMEVLSVSDLGTPLKENGEVDRSANTEVSLPFKNGSVPNASPEPESPVKQQESIKEVAADKEDEESQPNDNTVSDKDGSHKDDSDKNDESDKDNSRITKKRPLDAVEKKGADEVAPTIASKPKGNVGSFAEWKDRKKHKGLPKKGFSMDAQK